MRRASTGSSGSGPEASASDKFRMKMWQSRASRSRLIGVFLLGITAAFLAVAFVTAYVAFEMIAVASFIMGIFLIATELEPKVKLLSSAEGLLGPMLSLSGDLKNKGFVGHAVFVPSKSGVSMQVPDSGGRERIDLSPVGRGLVMGIEREIGTLKDVEFSYVKFWVPKALENGLELVEKATLSKRDEVIEATFVRPYVRPLCVREDFNRMVCDTLGCPLVGSVAEVLATSTGRAVRFQGCRYDPDKETSRALYNMEVLS